MTYRSDDNDKARPRRRHKMVLLQTYIAEQQMRALRGMAAREGVTRAEIVRRYLQRGLNAEG